MTDSQLIGWLLLAMGWSLAGIAWCLPFVMWFVWYYDTKTEKLKENKHD